MLSPQTIVVITASLSIFSVIGAGVAVRRIGWLTEEADRSLLSLIVNLLLPCFIFGVVVDSQALRKPENMVFPPLVGFMSVAIGCLIALAAAGWFGLKPGPQRRTFAFSTGLYNYGYVPIPLFVALFGQEQLGVLFVHNFGVELAIWTIGVGLLTRGQGGLWKRVINPPAIAIVIGMSINLLGGRPYLPDFIVQAVVRIGSATIPMGLLLVGATIADHLRDGSAQWRTLATLKTIAGATLLRLILLPFLFLFAAKLLPISDELKRVVVIQAAMPTAVIPIILAKHFGGDSAVALRVALFTSAVSLATIPLWISFGLKFLELKAAVVGG